MSRSGYMCTTHEPVDQAMAFTFFSSSNLKSLVRKKFKEKNSVLIILLATVFYGLGANLVSDREGYTLFACVQYSTNPLNIRKFVSDLSCSGFAICTLIRVCIVFVSTLP